MKEHPILFSTPMVQAISEGRKTQTRRVVKLQPRLHDENGWPWKLTLKEGPVPYDCPFGQPGDRLWVRETWAPALDVFAYKADYSQSVLDEPRHKGIWKPSIHMPKTAARIWLEIEEVKVERLQSISEEDAKAEGCDNLPILWNSIDTFRELWQKINGPESWKENPWVWVIKFKVLSTTGKPVSSHDSYRGQYPATIAIGASNKQPI